MPADPVIAILAAGASRRMRGADKLLEPVDGAPVLRRVTEAALGTGLDVLVTLPPGHPARRRTLEGLAVGVVEVPDAESGMAASFRALARRVPPGTPVLTLLGDMPEIRTEDIAAVARAFGDAAGDRVVRAASEDGMPGQPVAFPARLVPAFADLTGDTGARGRRVRVGWTSGVASGSLTAGPRKGRRMDGSKPWHLGPVAAIAVIWFAIGAADYTMTQSRFGPYVAQFPEAQIAYYTALPALVDALWAIAVWGGLIGAVLLWNGSSKAAVVLAIPAVSMVLATTWFLVLSDPPMQAITGPAGLWIMLTSAAGSVVFWLYARLLHGRGQI